MGHVPTVTAITTTHFLAAAARAGVDTASIAARLRLPASPSYEDRIPMVRLLAAWEAVMRAVGDPAFPLRAAEYPERDARSLLTMLCAVQPTIARAAEIVNRYWPTVTDAYRLYVEKRGGSGTGTGSGTCVIAIDPTGVPDRPGWRCHQEYDLADVVAIMSRLTGGAARPTRVTFRHRAEAPAAAYERAFGLPPRFSDERTSIVYPASVLALPVQGPPIAVAHVVKERLDALLDRARAAQAVTQRVRETIPALLRDGRPTAAEAARRLGLGRRTLERRLDDEGTSFRDLLADTRHRLARLWLPALPIAEVADRLAYGDVRAFDRAFHRWTGTTPSAWRARSWRSPRPGSRRRAT